MASEIVITLRNLKRDKNAERFEVERFFLLERVPVFLAAGGDIEFWRNLQSADYLTCEAEVVHINKKNGHSSQMPIHVLIILSTG